MAQQAGAGAKSEPTVGGRGAASASGNVVGRESPTFIDELKTDFGQLQLHRMNVEGQATDKNDKPLSNATVIIGYTNPNPAAGTDSTGKEYRIDGEIARVKTDEHGRFSFADLVVPTRQAPPGFPDKSPMHAPLQVIGLADGFGFVWSNEFKFQPTQRPADEAEIDRPFDNKYYVGEKIFLQLKFLDEVPLHGTITNDLGNALSGAVVRIGWVNEPRDGLNHPPSTEMSKMTPDYNGSSVGRLHWRILPGRAARCEPTRMETIQLKIFPSDSIADSRSHIRILAHINSIFFKPSRQSTLAARMK